MWAIENRTPFAAERTWVRERDGAETWLVAIRATFSITANGEVKVADEQQPVVQAPVWAGEPDRSVFLYDSDLYRTKVATDVILHGHAYAPGGRPVESVDVTMHVGAVNKTLRVIGDRLWDRGLMGVSLGRAEPFMKMPLSYDRAFGGRDIEKYGPDRPAWDERNPIGTGFARSSGVRIGKRGPNVEYPGPTTLAFGDPAPAGFGPIPSSWLPRRKHGGTYDEKWERERQPLLPEDFDDRFYSCAPEDQIYPGYMKGGEPVELRNLTPKGVLTFKLPSVVLGFRTFFLTGDVIHHRAKLHTVILEPDVPRVIIVWHTALPCHAKGLKLRKTTVVVKKRHQSIGKRVFPSPKARGGIRSLRGLQ
jgi:hypothetical protein